MNKEPNAFDAAALSSGLAVGPVVPNSGGAVDRLPPVPTPAAPRPSQGADSALLRRRSRGWEVGLPAYADARGRTPPVIIAVGGGKGGVGKSLVSANLAVRLAASGRNVVAIDLDIGGANLHTYFGLQSPRYNLADAIVYQQKSLRDVILPTSVDGVSIIAGGREEAWAHSGTMESAALQRLYEGLMAARGVGAADIVILDLGAGIQRHTLDSFTMAHLGILTVLPEPTSIENAYLFLKTSLFRLIENVGEKIGAAATAEAIKAALLTPDADQAGVRRPSGYAERLRQLGQVYPGFISQLSVALAGRSVGICVNQVRSQKDIDVGKSMELIGERYFGYHTQYCGYLNYDEAAWKSLRNRRPLTVDFPHSALARRFSELARAVFGSLGL